MFQNITGSDVTDCIDNPEDIYFVVKENQYGLAVGKNGVKIRHAERLMKKGIRVFEYSPDVKMFIANVVNRATFKHQVAFPHRRMLVALNFH